MVWMSWLAPELDANNTMTAARLAILAETRRISVITRPGSSLMARSAVWLALRSNRVMASQAIKVMAPVSHPARGAYFQDTSEPTMRAATRPTTRATPALVRAV